MPVFKDPKKLAKYLKEAANALQSETLITVQARLGSTRVSPVDTGRFRASWFAAEGFPSSEVAPAPDTGGVKRLRRSQARAAAKNAKTQAFGVGRGFSQQAIDSAKSNAGKRGLRSYVPNLDAENLYVDIDKTYFLTNNLPYAQALCIEGIVVSKSPTWFKDFRSAEIPKIQAAAARSVKREFQL